MLVRYAAPMINKMPTFLATSALCLGLGVVLGSLEQAALSN